MKFHHIGIATEDIEQMIEKMKVMFDVKSISNIVYDKNQDANLCMITISDGIQIELISGNVVEKLIKKRQYLYHTCYSVDNISESISKLVELGAFIVSEPKEAILFDNKKVCFLMNDLGLIELVESGE